MTFDASFHHWTPNISIKNIIFNQCHHTCTNKHLESLFQLQILMIANHAGGHQNVNEDCCQSWGVW